jgi:hypothetical protein
MQWRRGSKMNILNTKKDTERSTNYKLLSQMEGKLIRNCEYFEAPGAKPPTYANAYTYIYIYIVTNFRYNFNK